MNNEIKEAIMYLEHTGEDDFNLLEHQKENRIWAIKVLLDYITNLQEDNFNYRRLGFKHLYDKNKELDQEIKQLNNIINEIEAIVYADISNIDCRISIQEILDKLKELKENNK